MAYTHRMAAQRIQVLDAAGKPAANTQVQAKLVNHRFLFGMGAFDALPAAAREAGNINFYQDKITPEKKFYQDRVELMTQVFNYGTLPFYWGGYEPQEGNVLFQSRMDAAKLLISKGVKVKGHPLCWHTACADWLMEYDNATIFRKQIDRIHRDVTAFKGTIDMWDVINETVIMPVYDRYDNAITRICREMGRVPLIKAVFEAAKESNPNSTLLINDFNLSPEYHRVIAECLDAGAPIDAIGIQTHQHQGYRGKAYMEEVLERFSTFGLPLHFTENTLVSGQIMPADIVDLNDYQVDEWPTTPEGEERQKKEWLEMVELLFAHPLVEAVTGWDFADGAWLHAPSGVIRADNTPKPSYDALKDLIHNQWTTNVTLCTDANGFATLEGYKGTYTLTTPASSASMTLDGNKECVIVRMA